MQITERFWLEGTFKYLVAKPLQCMGTSFTRSSRSHQCSCCKLATSAGIRLLIHFLHLQWHSPLSTESELHPPQKKNFFPHLCSVSFFVGGCLHPCGPGVQWQGPERKAYVGCLCQHEGLAVWDNTFIHRDHCFFQHQHQRLGGPVSRRNLCQSRLCQENQDTRLRREY